MVTDRKRFRLVFHAAGNAVPQGSIARTPHGAKHSNEKTLLPWRNTVAAAAVRALAGQPASAAPLVVELLFFVARPKGHYGTGRNLETLRPAAPTFPTTNPDLDKLTRAVLDALTGIVYRDDAQVIDVAASKRYGSPGVHVWIVEAQS